MFISPDPIPEVNTHPMRARTSASNLFFVSFSLNRTMLIIMTKHGAVYSSTDAVESETICCDMKYM